MGFKKRRRGHIPEFNRYAGRQRPAVLRKRECPILDLVLDVMDLVHLPNLVELVTDRLCFERNLPQLADEALICCLDEPNCCKASRNSFRMCGRLEQIRHLDNGR